MQFEQKGRNPHQRKTGGGQGGGVEQASAAPGSRLGELFRENNQMDRREGGHHPPRREEDDRGCGTEQDLLGDDAPVGPVLVAVRQQRVCQGGADGQAAQAGGIAATDGQPNREACEEELEPSRCEERVGQILANDHVRRSKQAEREQENEASRDHVPRKAREMRRQPPLQHRIHRPVVHVHEGHSARVVDVHTRSLGQGMEPDRALANLEFDRHRECGPCVPHGKCKQPAREQEGQYSQAQGYVEPKAPRHIFPDGTLLPTEGRISTSRRVPAA